MRLLADFASRPSSRSRRVALRDGQRRRSRSAAVICRSFAYMSARLRRISAHCALVRGRRLPSGLPVVPQPETNGRCADLQVVMAYRYPGSENKAGIELYPVSGKKAAAAQTAGLAPSSISTLLVEGDNRPGLGHAIAEAIGDAEINMSFVMAQVVGRRYSAVFGFENESDASKAATLIKRATARGKK